MLSFLFLSSVSIALLGSGVTLVSPLNKDHGNNVNNPADRFKYLADSLKGGDDIGLTGATTCVSEYICAKFNDYYSQCVPGFPSPMMASAMESTSTSIERTPPGIDNVNYWFSFGDSYTQTGFVTNGTLPTPGNPLGNPTYPGQTAVGGTNWIDVDTTVYNNSLVLTYNYAYGGATIDTSLVAPYKPTVLSLTDQINEFLDTAAGKSTSTPWTSSNSLFSIWIGINDIGNSYYLNGDRYAFDDTLLNAEFALVQKLYNTGARNFLFINVPPIDRSPLMLAQSATSQATEKAIIADFNYKLAERISSFKTNHSWVQTWLWDSNSAFTAVLNSPISYGFVDATSYGNSGDFWGNNYYPSSAAHDIWGKEIALLLGHTVW